MSAIALSRLPIQEGNAEQSRNSIERRFDVPFVADLALREKQVQQNYRPIIAVHKWFARRPGSLFRALLLAEFATGSLRENFYRPHTFHGLRVADPFMGGGTPLLEANRLGFDVTGFDINPMAYWIVRQEIEHLDLTSYTNAARALRSRLNDEIGSLYLTRCGHCGRADAQVKYFIWVKTQQCSNCHEAFDLFPGYLLAENRRHPKNVFICASCGNLTEVEDKHRPGSCGTCRKPLLTKGPAKRNRCACPHCGYQNTYPNPEDGPPRHRMVALEYHCLNCRPRHSGRFFKKPDAEDLTRYSQASNRWRAIQPRFVPDDTIPRGDETDRLHRWGYQRYREMFNERQLLGLELIAQAVSLQKDERVRNALATNLSDLLRYQNMLCRYDTRALKCLDIFSVHGFPVGLVQCESNLLGIQDPETGLNVGSGGWSNITEKFARAKQYGEHPFEVSYDGGQKRIIPIKGEWIGDHASDSESGVTRRVELYCGSATRAELAPASLDAVFTDPPYYANVQYAELMDFCYVWLRKIVGAGEPAFAATTTRNADELTGNATMARGLKHFTAGLSEVFSRMATALKAGAPFVFTYHHKTLEAYFPVAIALLDARLTCSASLPCPAEMGASIHINNTDSSVVDTVFVCRITGRVSRRLLVESPEDIAALVTEDLNRLALAGVRVTRGDARCVIYGHLIRLAVWGLRKGWDKSRPWEDKMASVRRAIEDLGGLERVEKLLDTNVLNTTRKGGLLGEEPVNYGDDDEIPF